MSKTDTTISDAEQQLQRLVKAVQEHWLYIDDCDHSPLDDTCSVCNLKAQLYRSEKVLGGGQ